MSELQVIANVLEAWITEDSTPEARRAFAEMLVIDLAANGYRIVRSEPVELRCKNCDAWITDADVLSGRRLCTKCLRPWKQSARGQDDPQPTGFVMPPTQWEFLLMAFLALVTYPYRAIFGGRK